MAEKRGQYYYNDNGTISQLVSIEGTDSNITTNDIIPMEIQSRLASTIQTHNAVSVGASGNSTSASFIDCDGFDKVALTLLNDAATNSQVDIYWSHDGSSNHGQETIIANGGGVRRNGITDIKARYAKMLVYNNDSALAHTMSAWAMLKV